MKFVVLGGLGVEDDAGAAIGPASLRQRQLLAILLCHRGRRVTSDGLADQMWAGEPPVTAAKNLQVYVHRLRRTIGPERIEHAAEGYLLRCEDSEVDAARFDDLAQAGHLALSNGEFDTARAQLAEALALWKGEPFADLVRGEQECPEQVLLESRRLAELQIGAEEDHADAALAIGDRNGLIPRLTMLLAHHPLRERLRGALMLALHRSGRSAEALDLYRAGRQVLMDELAIEPGSALQELHHAILTDAPVASPPRSSQAATVVPAELPPGVSGFAGRSAELANLTALLQPPTDADHSMQTTRVITISGSGGIGKSAMAVQAAGMVLDDYPDGQVYINLRGATPGQPPLSPQQVLARLLRSFGLRDAEVPEDVAEAAARFRSLASDRRVLLVLDDAADAAQIRPVLPATSTSAVLITSRLALTGLTDHETHFQLDALTASEATALLANITGPERVAADLEGTADVVRFCDRLPLALRIAAARLVARPEWPPSRLARRLADTRTRLKELAYGDQAVASTCQVSHDGLPADTAEVFDLMGVLDLTHVTPPVVAALADISVDEAGRHLDELVSAHLMQVDGERHTMHDLVMLFARAQAESTLDDETMSAAIRRVAHHYLATERNAARHFETTAERRVRVGLPDAALIGGGEPLPDREAMIGWIRSEADNIVAAARQASGLPEAADLVTAMSAAVTTPFRSQGYLKRLVTLVRLALVTVPDERSERRAMTLYDLGSALSDIDAPADEWRGCLSTAVDLYDELNDPVAMARALERWALNTGVEGRDEESRDLFHRARSIYRRQHDTGGEGNLLTNAAVSAHTAGRYEEAVALLEQALPLFDADDDRRCGITLSNLGEGLGALGRLDAAAERLQESIPRLRRAGLSKSEAGAQWKLAAVLELSGRQQEADLVRKEALTLLVTLDLLTSAEAEDILEAEEPQLPDGLRQSSA